MTRLGATETHRRGPSAARVTALLLPLCLALGTGSSWGGTKGREVDLFDMSLSELLGLQITTAFRKAESISQAPTAVFVIAQQDIRRSGVTKVPEARRMAPGVPSWPTCR
ncbi:hypothetical protein [Thiocystis violacea]|uniref:hypothetical protein n=1 Tax=Thiocystis violacea TaxID=13725 RepID=UPI001903420B|nr:hypothetical protein [Thiocystis violacea]MBK1722237.1 hypothetical protein [Thiocystis violacea]